MRSARSRGQESAFAFYAVIVGPYQMQRSQYAFECLAVPAMILSHASAGAGQFWPGMIRGIGVQPLFQCARGQS